VGFFPLFHVVPHFLFYFFRLFFCARDLLLRKEVDTISAHQCFFFTFFLWVPPFPREVIRVLPQVSLAQCQPIQRFSHSRASAPSPKRDVRPPNVPSRVATRKRPSIFFLLPPDQATQRTPFFREFGFREISFLVSAEVACAPCRKRSNFPPLPPGSLPFKARLSTPVALGRWVLSFFSKQAQIPL